MELSTVRQNYVQTARKSEQSTQFQCYELCFNKVLMNKLIKNSFFSAMNASNGKSEAVIIESLFTFF